MSDFERLAAQLDQTAGELPGTVRKAATGAMGEVLANIQTGAPDDDGTYRASWSMRTTDDGAVVATSAPQAARLEFGYHGTDTLGRSYMVDAQPHVRPAVAAAKPTEHVVDAVKDTLG